MCQYKENLRYKSIMEVSVYNCRIKEKDKKPLVSKMISYYLSLWLSGDEVEKHDETTDIKV